MKICRICLTGPRSNLYSAGIAQKRRPGDASILESRLSLKVIMGKAVTDKINKYK